MIVGDDFIFTLHQFIIIIFCLFLSYFAWKDQAAKTYDYLNHTPLKIIVPVHIGIFIGLYSYFLHEWGSYGVFLGIGYSLLITLSVFDPKFAVSFFIFILISRPWDVFKDQLIANFPRDIFLLCFLSFIGHKIIRKKFYFQWNMATACVLLFALWAFFSLIPAPHITRGMINYYDVFIKGIIVYFLIVNVLDKKEYILPIQSALVMGIAEKSIISFYNSIIQGHVASDGRLVSVGILENSNDIAALMILAIPFSLSFFKGIMHPFIRNILGLIIFFFYFYLIWQAKSRGATLGIGVLVLAWFWLKVPNKKLATLCLIVGLCMSVGMMSLIKRESGDVEGSTSNRKLYWIAGVNMGIRNPLLGVGYDGFQHSLSRYAIAGIGTEGSLKTVHSTWLLAFAETGIVGFIFYIGIWIFSLKSAWLMRVEHPEYFLAILSYGTVITFLSHTYMLYPYILSGLTVASGQFYLKNKDIIVTKGQEAAITAKGF